VTSVCPAVLTNGSRRYLPESAIWFIRSKASPALMSPLATAMQMLSIVSRVVMYWNVEGQCQQRRQLRRGPAGLIGDGFSPPAAPAEYRPQQIETVHGREIAQHRVVREQVLGHKTPGTPSSASSDRLSSSTSTPRRLAYGRNVVAPLS